MAEQFDYIVVGAGTAGCTVADRLSENTDNRVLLIEAGGDDRHWMLQMPAGLRSVFKPSSRFNWWFYTTPQAALGNRRIAQPRGKVLGGSSSINGMTFLRGNPLDYDGWATQLGCAGWSFAECLPYFKRAERFAGPADAYRSNTGNVGVCTQQHLSPLNAAFLEAGQQAGLAFVEDVNGYRQEGVSRFDMSVEKGYRSSAARAHLHQKKRRNLEVRTQTRVSKVLVENASVVGVRIQPARAPAVDILASREVIMSAGVFGTPQILMCSGIGPRAHLESLGVQVICDQPAVGENLHDHLEAHIQVETDQPVSLNRELRPQRMLWAGIQWFLCKRGVAAVNQCHVGAFARGDDTATHPDLQIHFFPVFFGENWLPDARTQGYRLGVGPVRPTSRGRIRLDPKQPSGMPLIDPNYLASEHDRLCMRTGLRLGRHILRQNAFARYHKREASPGPEVWSDEQIDAFIRDNASSAYHPCGTCRMGAGNDPRAVVDPQLRFRGLQRLRIVDASIIPRIPAANINAPVFMIAEKASDLILGRSPLAAEHVDYYRAQRRMDRNPLARRRPAYQSLISRM